MAQNRIGWLDSAKGILITLVIAGHIIYPDSQLAFGDNGQAFIYSFHIPAFFIISGLLKNRSQYINKVRDFKTAFSKQEKTIRYYCVFSIIFFLRYILQFISGHNIMEDVTCFALNSITGLGMGALWFLPCFVISDLIFFTVVKYKRFMKYVYPVMICTSLLYLSRYTYNMGIEKYDMTHKLFHILFRSFIGSSFVFIGYYLDKLKCFEGKWLLLSIVSLGYLLNGGTDMRTLTVGNVLLYYMFATSGTMLIFLAAKSLSQYSVNQLFTKWGGILCSLCVPIPYLWLSRPSIT